MTRERSSALLRLVLGVAGLGGVAGLAGVAGLGACSPPYEQLSPLPIPLAYRDGLLYTAGQVRSGPDQMCGGEAASEAVAPQRVLIDLGVPLSTLAAEEGREPRTFLHAQIQINASNPDGSPGSARFLLCDQRLVRGTLPIDMLELSRKRPGQPEVSTGPLRAVLGGDLFGRFSLTLDFAHDNATLAIRYPDVSPACLIDDTVLHFRPLGGEIQVKVSDEVVTYAPTRVTVSACVEPAADPLRPQPGGGFVDSCLDKNKLAQARVNVAAELAEARLATTPDATRIQQLAAQLAAAEALADPACSSPPDLEALGDLVADHAVRRPGFVQTGANMRFLVSTATPDFLISETACKALGDPSRCTCADAAKVALRLPGVNAVAASGGDRDLVENGCPITLGGRGKAALAFVARQAQLSPCAELARSRRQRWSLPSYMAAPPPENTCLKEGCLENLLRSSSQALRRCGYSGIDANRACDDHDSPVAAYLELGGPPSDPAVSALGMDDTVEALVVPDYARVLQAANADIRNTSSQIDGVIGVSLLERLRMTVDYPAGRLVLSCRCDQPASRTCRAYRGVSYDAADGCTSNSTLVIPENFGRTICR